MFIAFSGVSACGKNTIMSELIKRRENMKVLEHSSATTRPPRESDGQFNTYVYLTKEEFLNKVAEGKFFEYEEVHGNYYGTLLSALEKAKSDKSTFYMRDIDVKGVMNLKKFFDKKEIYTIFLDAPDDVLVERLKGRGSDEADIEKRLSRSGLERSYKEHYDLVIENIDIEKTISQILAFLDKKA